MSKDTPSQDARRRFLKGGAVAAVGAVAAAVVPKTGKAAGPVSEYYPNDALAEAIFKAWDNLTFEGDLLTFPKGTIDPSWGAIPEAQYMSMLAKTRQALAQVNVFIDLPVVLTPDQYPKYSNRNPNEIVFVLPSAIGPKPFTLDTARVAMAKTVAGM